MACPDSSATTPTSSSTSTDAPVSETGPSARRSAAFASHQRRPSTSNVRPKTTSAVTLTAVSIACARSGWWLISTGFSGHWSHPRSCGSAKKMKLRESGDAKM